MKKPIFSPASLVSVPLLNFPGHENQILLFDTYGQKMSGRSNSCLVILQGFINWSV
ncbi:hypothetical protein CsatB_020197 [Cannabis sativa]